MNIATIHNQFNEWVFDHKKLITQYASIKDMYEKERVFFKLEDHTSEIFTFLYKDQADTIEKMQKDLEKWEEENLDLENHVEALQENNDELEAELEVLKEEKQELTKKVKSLKAKIKKHKSRICELEANQSPPLPFPLTP